MSVHQLTSQNFSITNTGRTKNLHINLRGTVLCFFKMDSCPGCNSFDPIFRQLASEEINISYSIINLTTSRDVVSMSRQTTTPITAVPFLLLFINGNPHAKYNGQKNLIALKSFINKALINIPRGLNNTQGFMPHQNKPVNHTPDINNQPFGYNNHIVNHNNPYIPDSIQQSNLKKYGNSNYNSQIDEVEEEKEDKLTIPDQITPYNVPWEVHYKKMM